MINKKQSGFTLVELMIATAVFSVVMLIGLYTYLNIGRTYAKGITIIRTQDTIRKLQADIATQLQYSNTDYQLVSYSDNNNYKAYCIGNKVYVYRINYPQGAIDANGESAALSVYALSSGGCPSSYSAAKSLTGGPILRKGTRVLVFNVGPVAGALSMYKIDINLLYEPDQDLSVTTLPLLIETTTPLDPSNYSNWKCKTGVKGAEYCTLVKLSSTVYRRTANL